MMPIWSIFLIVGSACLIEYFLLKMTYTLKIRKLELDSIKLADAELALKNQAEELIRLKSDLSTADKELAVKEQKLLRIDELNQRNQNLEEERNSLSSQITLLKQDKARLETQLAEQNTKFQEQVELLKGAKEQLKLEFENLAQKILEEKTSKFTEQNRQNLDQILNPFKEQIKSFREKVEEVYASEGKERYSLMKNLEKLQSLNETLQQEAHNLVRALKADTKAQGDWGEIILLRLLENSGLKEGIHYKMQEQFKTEEESLRPDVILYLPNNRHIIIDSKVSIVAYERYFNAENDKQREDGLNQHIKSLKKHVDELAEKRYDYIKELTTLDFVIMFVPIEAAFMVAVDRDRSLFTDAYKKHILLVCPSTLLVTIQMIASIWRMEDQNVNARRIADEAAAMYEKFVRFVDSLDEISSALKKGQDSCDKAYKHLATGRGNLIRRATNLVSLGVKTSKQLPEKLLLDTELESDAEELPLNERTCQPG